MNEFTLPGSPNWFLSSVSSGTEVGLYAFGSKNHVFVYDLSEMLQTDFVGDVTHNGVLSRKLPKLISCFRAHEQKVSAVCLSPDAGQLVCCSVDGTTVKLWDILSLTILQMHTQEHKDKVSCMTWSPLDQDSIFTGDEKGMIVQWHLKANTITSFQPQRNGICSIKSSPHSSAVLAIGYHTGLALIISIRNGQSYIMQKFMGHDSEITSICWCPIKGDSFLVGASNDESDVLVATAGKRLIKIWSLNTGKELFFKKIILGDKLGIQDSGEKKIWLDIQWPQANPEFLISSSSGPTGELFLWNLQTRKQYKPDLFDSSNINRHSRIIFNITFVGDKICTFSLDRVIAVWDLKSRAGLVSWPSFGGFPYCIRSSPVDPGMVAIGSGDNAIRIWNQNNKSKPFDVTTLFYGIRSMITSVAWHPEKEGLLAYGTEDGRVGIFNTLVVKPPMMSSTFHKKTVYVVCWGPPVQARPDSKQYEVCSLGDGTILQHCIGEFHSRKDAVNLVDTVKAANNSQNEWFIPSDIIWKADFTAFIIGCDNGSVRVYNFPDLRQACVINNQQRMVNCIRWHPEITAESIHGSPCRNWVAFAGCDQHISIVELPIILAATESGSQCVTLSRPLCQLPSHLIKTTDMCWSPHHDGRLVTVGYDRLAIVWNVKTCEVLASYSQHNDRMLTVLWSHLDPDIIVTGGFDTTVKIWRVSAQSKVLPEIKDRKKKKRYIPTQHVAVASHADLPSDQEDIKELQELLKLKQQQLLAQQLETVQTQPDSVGHVLQLLDKNGSGDADQQELHQKSLQNELVGQIIHEGRSIVQDFPSIASGQEKPATRHTPTDTGGGHVSQAPSPFTPPDTNASPPPPPPTSTRVDGAAEPPKLRSGLSATAPVTATAEQDGSTDDEGSDDDDHDDFNVADYDKVPSVSDLVVPVKPLKPKSGAPKAGNSKTSLKEAGGKVNRRPKTLFPVYSQANNKSKAILQEDVLDLTRILTGHGSPELVDSKPHLGVFADRLGAHRCLLQESEYHLSHDNMEYHLQLELWRGNVAGAVQIARQRNELSDWIVAMAPLASHDLWELVSAEYAEQLEEDGQYHKAATYLLASHKTHQAIDLFRRHRLFKEAVSLARIRLSPVDPLLEDLFTEWGQNLMKDGQFEQAAKCYLAMRHIQEAGKVLTRRPDPSSLKVACHVTLLANEKQQGLVYGYKVLNQFLVAADWQEAYKFITEHESLKVLLPVLITHELLIQQLMILCPTVILTKCQVTPEMFSQWEKKDISKCKTELPEFLIDRSEIDSVIPWEPLLIGEHTFPHHLLRVWHQQLGVTMATQELKVMHAAISQLLSLTQSMADLPNMLVLITLHITLCLLALLISETSSAITHLLQAVSLLHQANQLSLQQALCRLLLSQGPKYLLKLQQEFNAARVLITVESHGDVDKAGGESHNSIKKFLTDIKEDSAISMSSLRCRELDCLRAYYYLTVLDFLAETFSQNDNDSLDGMPNGKDLVNSPGNASCNTSTESETKRQVTKRDVQSHENNLADLDQNGKASHADFSPPPGHLSASENGDDSHSSPGHCSRDINKTGDDGVNKPVTCELSSRKPSPSSQDLTSLSSSSTSSTSLVPKQSSVDPPVVPSSLPALNQSPLRQAANFISTPNPESATSSSQKLPSTTQKSPSLSQKSPSSTQKSPSNSADSLERTQVIEDKFSSSPELKKSISTARSAVPKGCLNTQNLIRLSKGILWDVQAKREALTETLGYIHQAISQHLLLHRATQENTDSSSSDNTLQQTVNSLLEEDGSCHQTRLVSIPESETYLDSDKKLADDTGIETPRSVPACKRARSVTPQPEVNIEGVSHRGPFRSFSENYSASLSSPASMLEYSSAVQIEQELLGSLATEPVAYQKSRKILWMDGKDTCTELEAPSSKLAFQISRLAPDGNPIPVEWDSLPVDVKYSMPYVSIQLLRQEQDNMTQELKRVPDISKIPFPATSIGVKKLLHTCLRSPHLSASEKRQYIRQLNDWSNVFAVTTHQQNETTALFAAAETDQLTK